MNTANSKAIEAKAAAEREFEAQCARLAETMKAFGWPMARYLRACDDAWDRIMGEHC
jgi:hypothetical protein